MDSPASTTNPQFHAPADANAWDFLFEDYARTRAEIERITRSHDDPEWCRAMRHYLAAANRDGRGIYALPAQDAAISNLDAEYWQRAIDLTDVQDFMPAAARSEWHDSIRNATTPPFEPDSVRSTMLALLAKRADFLAEMVDGIFRGLSGEHVTNRPEGFYKRMIISNVTRWSMFGNNGLIQDLRTVVSRLMGRGVAPSWRLGAEALDYARKTMGQWVSLDGGAVMLRTYLKGTAHLQVHPQVAWRLNEVLAHRYPRAIPPKFRTAQRREKAEPGLYDRPLPWPVLTVLADMWRMADNTVSVRNTGAAIDKHVRRELGEVLCALGGAQSGHETWAFDYPPSSIIDEVVQSGVIPDAVAHQYYPTPDELAQQMVALSDIQPGNTCLEPSAGTGAIARLLPREKTTCVEVAALHKAVVETLGYHCYQADFMEWEPGRAFDRVVMNPPYSKGRWKAHTLRARGMLAPGGRQVALLPVSARNDAEVSAIATRWVEVPGVFPGTSMEVVILVADAP